MSLVDEPCCLCLETSPALLDDPCHHISRHFIVIVGRAMLLYTKIPSCYYLTNHAVIYLETSPALHKIPYHNVIRGSCKKFVTGFGLLQCYVLSNIFLLQTFKVFPPLPLLKSTDFIDRESSLPLPEKPCRCVANIFIAIA